MTARNMAEFWEEQALKYGPRTLLIDDATDERISYERLNAQINQAANLLLDRGVKKGDVVAMIVSNIPEFFVLFYAILKAGAVAMPVDYSLNADSLDYIFAKSAPSLVFIEAAHENEWLKTRAARSLNGRLFLLRASGQGESSFEAACAIRNTRFESPTASNWTDACWITFSSGSTGRPKLILHTQAHFLGQWRLMTQGLEFRDSEGFLCTQQLHYYDHIIYFGVPFFNGGFLVLAPKFSKSKFWARLERHRVQYANLFPVMQRILMNPPEDVRQRDLSRVRGFMSVGEVLRVDQQAAFESRFGCLLSDGYAANDFGWVAQNGFSSETRKTGTVGRLLGDAQVRIVKECGELAKTGQVGEIQIGLPTRLKEYYNSPELNAERIADGWLQTRDLGRFDDDGWLYICGRVDSVINVGGKKVFPSEIEGFIEAIEGVRACATLGVDDGILGQRIKSFVVLKDDSSLSAEEITRLCRERLSREKWPQVRIIDEIPIGPTGKFDYKTLACEE